MDDLARDVCERQAHTAANAGARASAFLSKISALAEHPELQSSIAVEVRVRGVNHEKLYSFR
jgi:hypothetical protein